MPVRRAQLQHIRMHAPQPNLGNVARSKTGLQRPNQTLGATCPSRTKRSGAPLPGSHQPPRVPSTLMVQPGMTYHAPIISDCTNRPGLSNARGDVDASEVEVDLDGDAKEAVVLLLVLRDARDCVRLDENVAGREEVPRRWPMPTTDERPDA